MREAITWFSILLIMVFMLTFFRDVEECYKTHKVSRYQCIGMMFKEIQKGMLK